MRRLLPLALLLGCNPHPGFPDEQVGYRDWDGSGEETTSGERGNVKITEVLWAGSVTNEGVHDPTDVFVEIRNEGSRPLNVSQWFLEQDGTIQAAYRIPDSDLVLNVGQHRIIVAKTTGCFPDADWVIPELALPYEDPFRLTLRDRDERLIEPAGSKEMPPFAGGYDLAVSRSMERVQLMFGGSGTEPHSWHHYTDAEVDVPNNDLIAEHCRERTLASPARPNSPDYSGAYATGSFE